MQLGSCTVAIQTPATPAPAASTPAPDSTANTWSFGFDLRPEWIAGGALALCCIGVLAIGLIILIVRIGYRKDTYQPLY